MVFTTELIIVTALIGGFLGFSILLMIIRLATVGVKTLSFDTNGGSVIKKMKIRKGKKVLLNSLPNPTKEGDSFICWCENVTLTQELEGFIMPASNKRIYAKWHSDEIKEAERAEAEKRRPVKNAEPSVDNKEIKNTYTKPVEENNKPQAQEEVYAKEEIVTPVEEVNNVEEPVAAEEVKTVAEEPKQAEQVRPVNQQPRPAEQPRPAQPRPAEQVRPASQQARPVNQQQRPAEQPRPTQPRPASQQARPVNQQKPLERETDRAAGYQYQFRQANTNAGQTTYAYSKYNKADQERLEKQKHDEKQSRNQVKLELISAELHYSIESLRGLDEQNIDILYRKAEKSKKARELEDMNKKREVSKANYKQNQYSKNNFSSRPVNQETASQKENEESVKTAAQSRPAVQPKPAEQVRPAAQPKPAEQARPAAQPRPAATQTKPAQQGYSSQIKNMVIDEVVEEAAEPAVTQSKPAAASQAKSKSAEKIAKLDQINKNFDKLNNELAELKELLLRSIK